jgi:Tol biopolymer transport system component
MDQFKRHILKIIIGLILFTVLPTLVFFYFFDRNRPKGVAQKPGRQLAMETARNIARDVTCSELARKWLTEEIRKRFDDYTDEALIFFMTVACAKQIVVDWATAPVIEGIVTVIENLENYTEGNRDLKEKALDRGLFILNTPEYMVSWKNSSESTIDGFYLYVCTWAKETDCLREADYQRIAVLDAQQRSFIVKLEPDQGFCYLLSAYNRAGEGPRSHLGCYTRLPEPPSPRPGTLPGKIAFASDRKPHNGKFEIYTMNADGTDVRRLTYLGETSPTTALRGGINGAIQPVWSPDAKRIAFARYDGAWNIYVINADGSGAYRLTNHPPCGDWKDCGYKQPTWSPDGREIAFSANEAEIWVIDVDGANIRKLTQYSYPHVAMHPAWSPDGTKIAFLRYESSDERWWLNVMSSDGSNLHKLQTSYWGGTYDGLEWSPDGKQIAFQFKGGDIYLMNADGTDVRNITERYTLPRGWDEDITPRNEERPYWAPMYVYQPTWSPDGKQIAFINGDHGRTDIWVVNADGSNIRNITHQQQYHSVRDPRWSPNLLYKKAALWTPLSWERTLPILRQ